MNDLKFDGKLFYNLFFFRQKHTRGLRQNLTRMKMKSQIRSKRAVERVSGRIYAHQIITLFSCLFCFRFCTILLFRCDWWLLLFSHSLSLRPDLSSRTTPVERKRQNWIEKTKKIIYPKLTLIWNSPLCVCFAKKVHFYSEWKHYSNETNEFQ